MSLPLLDVWFGDVDLNPEPPEEQLDPFCDFFGLELLALAEVDEQESVLDDLLSSSHV